MSGIQSFVVLIGITLSILFATFGGVATGEADTALDAAQSSTLPPAGPASAAAARSSQGVSGATYLIENKGQIHNDDVMFYARLPVFDVGFAPGYVVFAVPDDAGRGSGRGVAVRLKFEGAAPVAPRAGDPLPFRAHFFLGNDTSEWRTDVAAFQDVVYPDLYPGIDLHYTVGSGELKYEFLVRFGASPEAIEMRYEGADWLSVDENGTLVIHTPLGELRDSAPDALQAPGDGVECSFTTRGPDSAGIECEGWDPARDLIIDPLVYSTFVGGSNSDTALSIALDQVGGVYVAGITMSADFPTTPGTFDTTKGGGFLNWDAFVFKLNATGTGLAYATYIGGSGQDDFASVAVDSLGSAYVAGQTTSSDFPTTAGAWDPSQWMQEFFVAKLNPAGDALIYSTFIGGSGNEYIQSGPPPNGGFLALDPLGNAVVAGGTFSSDFPTTPGAYDTTFNGRWDAFVVKLDANGTDAIYSTLIGGSDSDWAVSVALDTAGTAYVTGLTISSDFPVSVGAFDTSYVGPAYDAFVLVLDPAGQSLVYATFLGGSADEIAWSVAADPTGHAFVTGRTASSDFPVTPGSYDEDHSLLDDAFVVKLDPAGTGLDYGTFLGGAGFDFGTALALDGALNAYVAVWTDSSSFPVGCGLLDDAYSGGFDALILKLDPAGRQILYGTFMGGTAHDVVNSIMLDTNGILYVAGETDSTDFPVTPGALQSSPGGYLDAFVAKLNLTLLGPATSIVLGLPMHVTSRSYVTSATPLSFSVVDRGGVGVRRTMYRIDGGAWLNYTSMGTFTLAPEGEHAIEWFSEDNANRTESPCAAILSVDNTPPSVSLTVGAPSFTSGADVYVTTATPVSLSATDGGLSPVGLEVAEYRIDGGPWTPGLPSFALPTPDGLKVVEFRAVDLLGNAASSTMDVVVDDTPPTTSVDPATGPFSAETRFRLTALDTGSGVTVTEYRIDGGPWLAYAHPFEVPQGKHSIAYRSVDQLGNLENERVLAVMVDSWKPAVALVFALALLAFGGWSSIRAPWRGRQNRGSMVLAFATCSLPFILAEAATGIAALLTGFLAIPPVLGLGAVVDISIVAAGLATSYYRFRRRPSSTGLHC